jgi:hypothetical protein
MPRSSTRKSNAPAVFAAGQGGGMGTSTKAPTTPEMYTDRAIFNFYTSDTMVKDNVVII